MPEAARGHARYSDIQPDLGNDPPVILGEILTTREAELLRATFEVALRSRRNGNHPFGALLADEHERVVLEAENTLVTEHDCTWHAETNLMRAASRRFSCEDLASFTLYSSSEPCAMCSGATYWGNVGHVVFGLAESELLGYHRRKPRKSDHVTRVPDRVCRRTEEDHGQRPGDVRRGRGRSQGILAEVTP